MNICYSGYDNVVANIPNTIINRTFQIAEKEININDSHSEIVDNIVEQIRDLILIFVQENSKTDLRRESNVL